VSDSRQNRVLKTANTLPETFVKLLCTFLEFYPAENSVKSMRK